MKKFNKIKEGSTLYFDQYNGPCFGKGGSDFYIYGDLNKGTTINCSFMINYELTFGEGNQYQVEELEIYKVI